MYETPIDSEQEFVSRTSVAAAAIQEMRDILQKVPIPCDADVVQACVAGDSRNFEHFQWPFVLLQLMHCD